MTPIEYYQKKCESGVISSDPQQLNALDYLQKIYTELTLEAEKRQNRLAFWRRPKLINGLYLWGGVGIGKTFMMDCFYECITFKQKMRMHFHQFMQLVHQLLKKHQGEKDPLLQIADDIAAKAYLLCFDELYVSDITDAMLLGRLFKALFARGVTLVTTSNVAPDELYKNGLQREQFLPAIELLKHYTDVLHMTTSVDYRLRHLKTAGVFYSPLDRAAQNNMEKSFTLLAENKTIHTAPITLFNRDVHIIKQAGDVIWFDFSALCTVPRSQMDYLAIAEKYRTVFISNVPIIPATAKDMICLFISMVDVFYDAKVRLVISAAEPVAEIYSRGYMIMEYNRTHSRLLEMQSLDYFFYE